MREYTSSDHFYGERWGGGGGEMEDEDEEGQIGHFHDHLTTQ